MGDFFKGWRRKFGCVALVTALAFTVGWTRSATQADFIGVAGENGTYYVISSDGLLDWQTSAGLSPEIAPQSRIDGTPSTTVVAVTLTRTAQTSGLLWGTLRLAWFHTRMGIRVRNFDVLWDVYDVEWKWEFGRFQVMAANNGTQRVFKTVIPYWPIVIPLTVISAYLLLSKPREGEAPAEPLG